MAKCNSKMHLEKQVGLHALFLELKTSLMQKHSCMSKHCAVEQYKTVNLIYEMKSKLYLKDSLLP